MTGYPLLPENVPNTARGGLSLEVFWNNNWVDVSDNTSTDLGLEFEPMFREIVVGAPASWEVRHDGRGGCAA